MGEVDKDVCTFYQNVHKSFTEHHRRKQKTIDYSWENYSEAGRSSIVSMACECRRFSKRCVSIAKIMIETGNEALSCALRCMNAVNELAKLMLLFFSFMKYTNLYIQIKENKCNYSANSKLNYNVHNTYIQVFLRSFSLKTVSEFDKERIVHTSGTNCTKCSNVKM